MHVHQNAFGDRALPGPAGGAIALPQAPWPLWGREGKGMERKGRGRERRQVRERGREKERQAMGKGKRGMGRECE